MKVKFGVIAAHTQRDIVRLMRASAPMHSFSIKVARELGVLVEQLVKYETHTFARFAKPSEMAEYHNLTVQAFEAMATLGLNTYDLANAKDNDQLADFIRARCCEAVLIRSVKHPDDSITMHSGKASP